MNDWQPIETMPANLFALVVNKYGRRFLAARSTKFGFVGMDELGQESEINPIISITHWMPLPTAPGEK